MHNEKQNVLIIGLVWPEPNSTGASVRLMEHIDLFLSQNWQITFICPAAQSEYSANLEQLGIQTQTIEVNNCAFDAFVRELMPDIALFDRFLMEEQFGWRVEKYAPDALRIIETIDLHCLREARHAAVKAGTSLEPINLNNDTALREIAAIYRSDLSIIISDYEMDILQNHFMVPADLLHYCPFMLEPTPSSITPGFAQRHHFMTIGNFRHEPNWDAVLWLKTEIWPLIRKQLPKAELHIYGAYTPPKATALHNPKEGFLIKDRAANVRDVMQQARICLAPLRFGAGIKTKLADAMVYGTPTVTTDIGAEGMSGGLAWAGAIENEAQAFADAAVNLHQNQQAWETAQTHGFAIVDQHFSRQKNSNQLLSRILALQSEIKQHRQKNFTGAMLRHHHQRSTEFMSRWIEAKNRNLK